MKIHITQEVDVPISPYCKNCFRKEYDRNEQAFCTIFNRFLFMSHGNYLKCRECYMSLYDTLEREE